MAMHKEMNELIKRVTANGWTFKRGAKHDFLVAPDGRNRVTIARSTSDTNAVRIALGNLRRIGYVENYKPEKDKVVYTSPDPKPDPAVAAAQAVDERKQAQDHTVAGATRRLLRENPGKAYSVEDAYIVVKARMPEATRVNVAQTLSTGVTRGDLVRAGRGMYKYVNGSGNVPEGEKQEIELEIKAPPKPVKMTTGDATIDQMLEKIDQALLALGEIEEVVSWVQERMNKLAEFKKALGG